MAHINKRSFEVVYDIKESQNIKDIATRLYQSIKRSNLEMSITETALLRMFLQQCGVIIIDGEGK